MKDFLLEAFAITGGVTLAVVSVLGIVVIVVGLLAAALWPLWLALAALKYLFL